MPAAYCALGGRMAAAAGFDAVYVGTSPADRGGERAAADHDRASRDGRGRRPLRLHPTICDAGAGFGEPCNLPDDAESSAGVAGVHIETSLPKRALPQIRGACGADREFIDKIASPASSATRSTPIS
jgi:2-methylisocitrate lyase-like PEP mutase family enzyme